ncbi:MAG: hypothetical protein JWQ28_2895, partial [Pedobacter sp.]|nr:hypothetical protein [Pedobacter sp.]
IVLNKLIGDSIEKLRQSRVVKSHSHQKTTLADDYTPLKALKSSQQ